MIHRVSINKFIIAQNDRKRFKFNIILRLIGNFSRFLLKYIIYLIIYCNKNKDFKETKIWLKTIMLIM